MSDRRRKQASHIDRFGFDVMPCSRCIDSSLACRMSRGSAKCSACIRSNMPCDGNAVPLDSLDRLGDALDRIEAERQRAEEEEEKLVADFHKALAERRARRRRLEKQRALLQKRGVKMLEKEAKDLDELEEMEKHEAAEAATARAPPPNLGSPLPELDWSTVDWSVLLQEPLAPTSGSGTAAEVSGSSQGG
jgi:hypothetical protein